MTLLLGAFFLAAALAGPLFRLLGRSAFFAMALVPAAGLVVSLAQAPAVLSGAAPWEEAHRWLPALELGLVLRMDSLSWILSLLVTGVGALVFLYCARYFDADEVRIGRFAGVLMAFAGMMYGLVVADEMLTLYLFWEGTTVFSFLLIGQYAHRQQSRRAALQALIVTTFGGLTMLVGMILISVLYGTGRISSIVERGFDDSPLTALAVFLILVGALSKSALIPFHFWLPGAMAAPTPVSAYLHAAAMVKAGIYLILRLAPGFAETPGWRETLIALGIATMLLGGWQALRQHDLKLILAYGTVSQLGFMVTVSSFGDRDITTAALALLLGHSMFKAVLFLTVGIIDHRVGTRDLRKLTGYGRAYPAIAVIGTIAAASMAGLPPTLGFVAKEAVYSTLLDHGTKLAVLALIGAFLGSVLTVGYSARFVWGAFADKRDVEPLSVTGRESPLFALAPAVLAVITVVGAFCGPIVDAIIASFSHGLPGSPDKPYYIALWHGFEPALLLSGLTLACGLTLFLVRRQVSAFQEAMPAVLDFHRGYRRIVQWTESFAAWLTARTQRGSAPFYQGVIYVMAIGLLGVGLLANDVWPQDFVIADSPLQVVSAVLLIVASIAATQMDKRFAAVVVVGIAGYAMVILFALQGAPDLALTQLLVETITIVVFVLVLRRLPARIGRGDSRISPAVRGLIAVLFGTVMVVVAVVALGARLHEPVSELFPQLAYERGHGQNVVNVTLVDIRAWDTLGELSVVIAAATGVASLIFVSGRSERLARFDRFVPSGSSRYYTPIRERVVVPQFVSDGPRSSAESQKLEDYDETEADTRNAWLLAGRTLNPRKRSIVLEVTTRLIFHAIIVFSIYLLFAGHNQPGGGFAAGLVAGLAFILRYLAGGRYELAEAVPIDAGKLLGVGILLAAGTGLAGYIWGDAPLTSFYASTELPVLGYVSFGSSVVFDIGVYFIVIGLMLDILRSLGAEVDLQQIVDEDYLAGELPEDSGADSTGRISVLLGRVDQLDVDGRSAGGRL